MTRSGLKRGAAAANTLETAEEAAAKRPKTEEEEQQEQEQELQHPHDDGEHPGPGEREEGKESEESKPPPVAANAKVSTRRGSSTAQARNALQQQQQQQQTFNPEQLMANFDHYLFQLLAFKVETGNYHVPKDHILHHWLQFLKKEFKNNCSTSKSCLSDQHIKVLEFLHVPLTSRGEEHWNRFYELLRQYHQRHSHVLVPRLCEVPGLGDWVTDQRRQYKSWKQGQMSQLTQERRDKLEQLGFAWQVRNRPEWDLRFQQLLDYKVKNGDCKVPQHYKENKALGKWVAKQREQFKLMKKGQHSFLTPYRLEKLNQAGFVWQVRTALDNDDEEEGAEGRGGGTKILVKEEKTQDVKGGVEGTEEGTQIVVKEESIKDEAAAKEEDANKAPEEEGGEDEEATTDKTAEDLVAEAAAAATVEIEKDEGRETAVV